MNSLLMFYVYFLSVAFLVQVSYFLYNLVKVVQAVYKWPGSCRMRMLTIRTALFKPTTCCDELLYADI